MSDLDYEKKIYGSKDYFSFPLLNRGLVNIIPKEIKEGKGKILDVGCGAGSFIGEVGLRNSNLSLYGVDNSRNAIAKAKKDFPLANYKVANAYDLPYKDNNFDFVSMICVLEHLKNPEKTLKEVKRVLKKNGIFYSITPIEGDKYILSASEELNYRFHGHLQRFSKEQLESLLEKNKFMTIRYFFWGFIICQIVAALYLYLLKLLNLPQEYSVKGYVDNYSGNQVWKNLLSFLRKLGIFIINLESLVVSKRIKGLYMCVISKNGK